MPEPSGAPPASGWARLAPELLVEDLDASLHLWRDLLGFRVAFARPDPRFAYLERPEGAQIMLCERSGRWETGTLERPYGRGVMFQVYVDALAPVLAAVAAAAWPLHTGPREVWRRVGAQESGQREVFVQDPDGYLVMVAEDIGIRAISR